ncbi:ATP-binding protein [Lacrimispora sp. 210928-DFI.3.58]|uniref:ATP-binding protein n=1 Tax=Lacrimispora sp. 210928-DFI.3.58 TaxID=2883214 RepID=UPI001D08604E|nr:ATP-binding protein [Lacrimispora sp. 210928-DFI.3.58]MCB7320654.1 ATPase [Lacrimispora sp. 210928-DFI.3.58]
MNEGCLEITWQDLEELQEGDYQLVDIRGAFSAAYGVIPEAVNIPQEELSERVQELPEDKKLILYCTRGMFSRDAAEELRDMGYDAYSLEGGYNGWLLAGMKKTEDGQTRAEKAQKSIQKRFRRELLSKFARAVREYELIRAGDRIAVCISGGKDSMLMAKLFEELKSHDKIPFELVFLVMDPGYSEANRLVIENNARLLNIPVTIFESDIFEAVYDVEKSPCYLCARMRRGHLYSKAKELGCNKIALGHHYDDVIETILMGMLYGGQIQTMMPKLHSTNFEGMELIRPMYLIREEDIKKWRDYNELTFIQCACRFTDTCTTCRPDGSGISKRMEVKQLIAEMKKVNPFVEGNIFKSVENVNLDTVIEYKKQGKRYHFLEQYEERR